MVGEDSTNILRGVPGGATAGDDILGPGAFARARAEVLPVRASTSAKPGALLLALALGVFSGVLVAMLAAVHLPAVQQSAPAWRLLAAGAALLSAWFLARHARSLFTVLQRATLLGALQWLALGLFGAPRALPEALAGAGPLEAVNDTLRAGLLTSGQPPELFTGPLALVLAGACLAAWLLVGRLRREWALDEPGLRS